MPKMYTIFPALRASILMAIIIVVSFPSFALVAPSANSSAQPENTAAAALSNMSVEDFLALSPRQYREMTGQKLSLTQKISLKVAQKQVKKALKNNEEVKAVTMQNALDTSDFNVGGFVLGLLLSVVGVLIAYLIGDTTVIKWAWIGFGVFMVIFLLAVLL